MNRRSLPKNNRNLINALEKRRPKLTKKSPKLKTPIKQQSVLWGSLYALLTLAIIIFIFSLLYHWFVENESYWISKPKQPITPEGVPDMPSQEGAPIEVEEAQNETGNPYLYYYGSPDSPGFSQTGHRNVRRTHRGYIPPGQPVINSYYPRQFKEKPLLTDYYLGEELDGVSRERLNARIQEENEYIEEVNRRVRQINRGRMYGDKYIRNKAQLAELRNFERRLANKVHRESQRQPVLSDLNY